MTSINESFRSMREDWHGRGIGAMTPEQGKCSVFFFGSVDGCGGGDGLPHCALLGRARAAVLTWVVVVARFPSIWETVVMAKRSLRILKRVSNVPSLGICESCNAQFSADPRQLGQAGVQQQFNAHKCEAMQNAVSSTKETAKKEAVKVDGR
jgi:hypothetical protein